MSHDGGNARASRTVILEGLPRQATEEKIQKRLGNAAGEMAYTEKEGFFDAVIVNDGPLATLTANASRSRRFADPRIVLDLGDAALLAGRERDRVGNLEAHGDRREFRWIVTGNAGAKLSLTLTNDPIGGETKEVSL